MIAVHDTRDSRDSREMFSGMYISAFPHSSAPFLRLLLMNAATLSDNISAHVRAKLALADLACLPGVMNDDLERELCDMFDKVLSKAMTKASAKAEREAAAEAKKAAAKAAAEAKKAEREAVAKAKKAEREAAKAEREAAKVFKKAAKTKLPDDDPIVEIESVPIPPPFILVAESDDDEDDDSTATDDDSDDDDGIDDDGIDENGFLTAEAEYKMWMDFRPRVSA